MPILRSSTYFQRCSSVRVQSFMCAKNVIGAIFVSCSVPHVVVSSDDTGLVPVVVPPIRTTCLRLLRKLATVGTIEGRTCWSSSFLSTTSWLTRSKALEKSIARIEAALEELSVFLARKS